MLIVGPGRYRPDADPDSALWLAQLRASGAVHDAALIRLHELLLRIARSEVRRRAGALRLAGPEADDLAYQAQARDLVTAVRRAVEQVLTDRQRQVFVALVVHGVPLDALVLDLGTTRGAIYKMMFDARGKLRGALAADGYVGDDEDGEGPAPDASASGVPEDARAVT